MSDKIVTVRGVAQLAKANMWPYNVRTEVGMLETGEPVSVFLGTPIVYCRPQVNRIRNCR
jgi:hypothetical protein